jgi:aminopeptidase-like protein
MEFMSKTWINSESKTRFIDWIKDLFPMNRSLSGIGNLQTLEYLQEKIPNLKIKEIPSGIQAYDWEVPNEWEISDGFIETTDGRRFAEFKRNNLHIVGYSDRVDKVISKTELLKHVYFLEDQPEAIPYVTSYYLRQWGFCLKKSELEELGDGPFRVFIDSQFKSGVQGGKLIYGELVIPGKSTQEVLFSTYICHPSMANNELSGPVVATALASILDQMDTHYTYRFLFLPETIGAVYYLSKHIRTLQKNVIAGWVLTCIGDSGLFSYIPSRIGNNYADRCTLAVLNERQEAHHIYSWLDRGSDERQYCAPGVDLPICSITRSKYGTYNEYHTSLDNLDLVSERSLRESIFLLLELVEKIESQRVPKMKVLCEPQMGKRGLYPNTSTKNSETIDVRNMMNVISYFDGGHTLQEISEQCGVDLKEIHKIIDLLQHESLIEY